MSTHRNPSHGLVWANGSSSNKVPRAVSMETVLNQPQVPVNNFRLSSRDLDLHRDPEDESTPHHFLPHVSLHQKPQSRLQPLHASLDSGLSIPHLVPDDQHENPFRKSFHGLRKSSSRKHEQAPEVPGSPFGWISLRWHSGTLPSRTKNSTRRNKRHRKDKAEKGEENKAGYGPGWGDLGNPGYAPGWGELGNPGYGSGWMFNPALQTRRQDTLRNNSQRPASNPYSSREYIQGHINSQPGKNLTNSDSTKNLHQSVSQHSLELQPTTYTPHKDPTQQGRNQHSQTHPKQQGTAQQHSVDFRLEERALSPTPSSYNFNNNNAVPKRSSFPKNLDDLDISIKNNIEKIRNVYEKSDQNAEKKRNSSKTKNKVKNDSTKRNSPGKDNGLKSTSYPPFSIKYNNNNNNNGLGESSQYLYQQRSEFDSYLEMDNPQGSSTKMREDFDEKHRKRKRHHLIFLLIVMFIVAVAVLTTVLAATLGTTQGKLPPPVLQNYSVVMANMTLKILNRDFHVDLLQAGSDAFKNLATSYSIELDELFQRSSLSSVYSRNRVLYFRNGSIYATSSITFLDEGLINSPQDVENVITSAEVAPDWKLDGAVQLGQYVVCRSCAETKLEFLTVHEKPEVKADNLEPTPSTLIGTNHTDMGTTVTSAPLVSGTPTTTSHDLTLASSRVPDSRDSTPSPDPSRPQTLTTASPSTTKSSSDTRATTLKWDTTQPFTTLSVSNVTANISSPAVTISCDVYNPTSWTDVILWHTSLADETTSATTRQKLLRLDPSGLTTVSGSYIDRSRAYYDVSDARITIKLTLSKLSCQDDGYVECTVTEASGARISRIGRLEITVPPSPPRLTIPLNVIANMNLPSPITCQADTGYPPWELTLSVKLPNSSLSHSLPTDVETRPNGCTLTMILKVNNYQPSMAVHGAELTCELRMTDQHSLIDQQVMQVIQANICDGASNASLLPHPYNCSLLVQCLDDRPAVVSCPGNQTNNNVYERCGLASPDVIFETTTGVINKDLTRLHCSVSTSVIWSDITIAKMTSSTSSRDVITVSAQKHPTWLDLNMGGRALANFRSLTSQNVLEIWIYELKCSDAGRYKCRVQTPSGSIQRAGELKVYERTKTPVISLKGNIVGGDSLSGNMVGGDTLSGNMVGGDTMAGNANPTTIRCEAQVGFPEGTLILQQKPRGQTEFQTVPFSNVSTVQVSSCMSSQVGEYLVPPRLNGSVFRCLVLVMGRREDLVADLELFLVPASTCVGLPPILLPHPVDCRYFIQCAQSVTTVLSCGQNFCFNVTSQQCDILATALSRDIKYCTDNHTPFAPHGDMCATFVQCGPDKETVRFCPEGELYATSDLCTPDINQSYCYNNTMHARDPCGGQGVV